ncbi:phage/plasmid primase, P4 family [Natronoarchaeum rubrum]|uniref:phage/plasmid primase, P4 family n=2 Tax=Natronoarchaeum rubrum TaxID=755311 RepID=UPI0021117F12|nr:phage/plasmid primase, P4 family [Natronoarchaeum rubrum]
MSEQFENIPDELTQRDQWLYWNASADKPRKPLASPAADYGAAWSDPDEWMSFDEVVDGAGMVSDAGIGYVNASDNDDYARGLYGVIDMDGCVNDEGRPKEWLPSLQPFFDRDAYMEFSPSSEGIHIPIAGFEPPEWWTDQHFSDDEHEGVEALTNKFSTFTGDTLKNSGEEVVDYGEWVDEWLLEAYKAITGEDPFDNETDVDPDDAPDGSSAGQPGDRDEWMDEDLAKEALDEINPDVSYSTWRDIGMALSNHFGESRGKALFRQWSNGGTKWDSEAEKQADRIVSDAGNYNYDIGTLVYHASQHGWDASSAARQAMSDGGTKTTSGTSDTASPETTTSPGDDWSLAPHDVIKLAVDDPLHTLGYDEDGQLTGGIRDIRTPEKAHYVWELAKKTDNDNVLAQFKGPLYSYNDGVWRDDGRQRLREIGGQGLNSAFSKRVTAELEEQVRMDRTKQPEELGAPDGTIVTESGLLDLRDLDVEPVRPDHYALAKIPTEHDPDAECPRWEEFVEESIDTEVERKKLQEYAGYTLWHHSQDFGKAMFFVGPTDSGKGTALKAIKQVIGGDNVAAESLHELIQTRWGAAQLFGNIVNIRNEVTPSGLSNIQKFKELTGGEDEISAEFKGKTKFNFVVTQKFMFSTNEVPTVENADEAFYNRLLFVRFPNTVPPEDQDKDLLDKLADERSGMLNWMLEGLNRLLDQGQFTGERSINGKKEICDAFGGVLDRFTHHCLMVTGNKEDTVKKADLHELAQAYADDIDKEPEWDTQSGFSRKMGNQRSISAGQKKIDGKNHKVFKGVRVKPEVVYQFNKDIIATSGTSDDTRNTGLGSYDGVDLRPGYDSTNPIGGDGSSDDSDDERGDDDETSIRDEPLAPIIIQYVRDHQPGREGVPHSEVLEALVDRGAKESRAEQWLDKCLKRGDIHEPVDGHYRV